MRGKKNNGKLYTLWLSFSMKQKLCSFAGAVIVTIGLVVFSNTITTNYALHGFGVIMDDNVRSYAFLDAVTQESEAFENYVRTHSGEHWDRYEAAAAKTRQSVRELPYDYELIGADRYAKTWSICNAYETYVTERDHVLMMAPEDADYITSLYRVYKMQDYLDLYARKLIQLSMQEGNDRYLLEVPVLRRIPAILLVVAGILIGVIVFLTFLMWKSMVTPVRQLAHLSRKIARNEFPGQDLVIENRDEMGELVAAFNKMKHATIGYIGALEEKYEMTQLLHQEELERVEMEKNLEATRLEMLKSQINPHFLFNTLNMISCMAKLEEAGVTDKMINSLSNLFRYNLKTMETEVPLSHELKIVDDYMYLQQMRFGSRITYEKSVSPESRDVIIPSFSLQPIVENAIIHGLSKKEQGGRIYIRACLRQQMVVISVMDSGAGMDKETLHALREALGMRATSRVGIGLGNIYKRVQMMYEDADIQIYSKKNTGTVVQMKLPQRY